LRIVVDAASVGQIKHTADAWGVDAHASSLNRFRLAATA
jgi:hypothetical protein